MGAPSRRCVLGFVGAASVPLLAGCAVEEPLFGDDGVPGGHIFVENRRNQEAELALLVTDGTTGNNQVLNWVYRIPESHVLEFEEVLESGNTYELRAHQPEIEGLGETDLSVTVETCGEDDPSDKLDVLIIATDHGPDIITFDCDEEYTRDGDLTYVEPGEYWIRLVTPTPTPTPES